MTHVLGAAEVFEPLRVFLVTRRRELGLTRAEVAQRIGCQPKQLESWEKPIGRPGKVVPTNYWTAHWARALGGSLAIVLDEESSA